MLSVLQNVTDNAVSVDMIHQDTRHRRPTYSYVMTLAAADN